MRAGKAAPDRRAGRADAAAALRARPAGAVVLYFVQSDLPASARSASRSSTTGPSWRRPWPRCGRRSGWRRPGRSLLVELAYAADGARAAARARPRSAARCCRASGWPSRWSFAFSFAYVASERDKKVDLAYFRTSRPGEVTRRIVAQPRSADRGRGVLPRRQRGARGGRRLPQRPGARSRASSRSRTTTSTSTRSRPRSTASPPTASLVFVRGAQARAAGPPEGDREARKSALQDAGQGSPAAPADGRQAAAHGRASRWATASAPGSAARPTPTSAPASRRCATCLHRSDLRRAHAQRRRRPHDTTCPRTSPCWRSSGPQKPFQPEESAAINRFIDGGGRAAHRARSREQASTCTRCSARSTSSTTPRRWPTTRRSRAGTHQKISDRANLVTATFSSHPSVTTLQRLGARAPVVLPGRGLDRRQAGSHRSDSRSTRRSRRTTRRSPTRTATSSCDPGEEQRAWELAATAVKKDARVFVIADSDWFGDEAIQVRRQQLLALDVIALADGRRGVHRARPRPRRTCRSPTPASRTSSGSTRRSSSRPRWCSAPASLVTRKTRRKRRKARATGRLAHRLRRRRPRPAAQEVRHDRARRWRSQGGLAAVGPR